MLTLQERLNKKNWKTATNTLSEQGFVLIKDLLSAAECSALIGDNLEELQVEVKTNPKRRRNYPKAISILQPAPGEESMLTTPL